MRYLSRLRPGSRAGQRGSVLSGLLVIIALLGLIAAALLPEVSSYLMASRRAADRVRQEAALSSALESRLRGLQNAPLAGAGACSADALNNSTSTVTLNGVSATATYVCRANTSGYATGPAQLAGMRYHPFSTDGARLQLGTSNELVIGDSTGSGGMLYDYQFGITTPLRWSLDLGATYAGAASAPPAGGVFGASPRVLLPLSVTGTACGAAVSACVMEINDPPTAPGGCSTRSLAASAGSQILARPALGVTAPANVYFGDSSGIVWAYNGQTCAKVADNRLDAGRPLGPVVAGPLVISAGGNDQLYVVIKTAAGSVQPPGIPAPATLLVHYSCAQADCAPATGSLAPDTNTGPLPLWATATGVGMGTVLNPAPGVPAGLAVTGADGNVAIAAIASDGSMFPGAAGMLPGGATTRGAPTFCAASACGSLVIGVGTDQGTFYTMDAISLASTGSYVTPATPAIRTTPGVDAAGNWFFGADDGYLYQVQSAAAAYVNRYGPVGAVRSSPVVSACGASSSCVYFGSGTPDNAAYMVNYAGGQATRNGYVYACVASSPPTCSPGLRLWARVVATGSAAKLGAWSYYLP